MSIVLLLLGHLFSEMMPRLLAQPRRGRASALIQAPLVVRRPTVSLMVQQQTAQPALPWFVPRLRSPLLSQMKGLHARPPGLLPTAPKPMALLVGRRWSKLQAKNLLLFLKMVLHLVHQQLHSLPLPLGRKPVRLRLTRFLENTGCVHPSKNYGT